MQGLKGAPWDQDLGWLGTLRPRGVGSWLEAACSGFGMASPILGVAFDSLSFLLGIHLWEISGEGKDSHTYFTHWETEAKPPMVRGSSSGKWG